MDLNSPRGQTSPTRLEGMETAMGRESEEEALSSPTRLEGMETGGGA